MTGNEWDWQYKQQVCTDKNFKQWMEGAATNAMTMTVKQVVEKHQETSRRELVDESSTVLCSSSKSIHSIPWSGILSTAASYLEVYLNCEC